MYQIDLINRLLSQYKIWTMKLKSAGKSIENNILQKDDSDPLEQKIMSIGISMVFVWIVTSIIGLLGGSTGGFFVGLVLFGIGWLLSKLINKTVFGTPRKIENISDGEKALLNNIKQIESTHIAIRENIKNNTLIVNFTDYAKLKKEFEDMLYMLENFNTIHLALKYKLKHKYVVTKYKVEVDKFHKIYAHK
ncbi:MAG: hypothetical protein IE909_09835 [Campylobacterales bacterium]|nr:hypothetical protein [Campylobacterales bacterium]